MLFGTFLAAYDGSDPSIKDPRDDFARDCGFKRLTPEHFPTPDHVYGSMSCWGGCKEAFQTLNLMEQFWLVYLDGIGAKPDTDADLDQLKALL